MAGFDRSLKYQIGLFYAGQANLTELHSIGKTMSACPPGVSRFGFRLGVPTQQTLAVQTPGGQMSVPVVIWKAGSGVWEVVMGPERLDVFFDARGYQDLTDEEVGFQSVRARVLPGLLAAIKTLGIGAYRVAGVINGECSCEETTRSPSEIVVGRYVKPPFDEGDVPDVGVRINCRDAWNLGGATPTTINRISTLEAVYLFGPDGTAATSLKWQADVNTAPEALLAVSFEDESIEKFFDLATTWLDVEKQDVLDSLRDDEDAGTGG